MGVIIRTEAPRAPIDQFIPYANNARTHSPEQINKLRSALRSFGFINPVLVDREFNVIAGHGRLMAARQEGMAVNHSEINRDSGFRVPLLWSEV